MVSKTGPVKKHAKEKFTPEVKVGVMLFNEKYGKTSHGNLESVVGDEVRVRAMFKFLGILDENTFYRKDATYNEVDILSTDIKRRY
jgi:hypothetical protein